MSTYIELWTSETPSLCHASLQHAFLVNVKLGNYDRSCHGHVLSLQLDQYITCLTGNPGVFLKADSSPSFYRLMVFSALTNIDRARVPFHLHYFYNGLISINR